MKKIIKCLICFGLVLVCSVCAGAEEKELEDRDILAKNAVVIDGTTGRILYGKNSEEKAAMASTTKIMTCIVALENSKMDSIAEVSDRAVKMPKVHMGIRKGEKYYMKDLLYAMMLESYNDVAVCVAENVAGSVENFAKLMNKKAKEIGAYNTNFVTPNGLDAANHYSTAYDMAIIGAYAVKNKDFLKITNSKSYSFSNVEKKRNFTVSNKDAFLTMDNNAIGIKTGFTGKAGYCFVGAVNCSGRVFVSAVLGCGWPPNKSYKWKDTGTLMKYAKDNYDFKELLEKDKDINVKIEHGTKEKIKACVMGESNLLIGNKEKYTAKTQINYKFPIKVNDTIGKVDLYIQNKLVQSRKIVSKDNVEEYNYRYCIKKAFDYFVFQ